ncbi:MAG: ABC transporter permease [Promethearchaeota archaeon]
MKQKKSKGGVIEFKIAYRSLLKRPIRTIFTIIAVALGVSIFFAVNIAMDSIEQTLRIHLEEEQFGYVNRWIYLIKGIFTMLSTISLFICIIIIKNLMEMTKEDQLFELGLLRVVGSSKRSIFMTFFYQVLIIALIGTALGLLLGYFFSFLLFNPLRDMLNSFTYLATEFEIQTHASILTLIITPLAGVFIPLIFGIIPTITAMRSNVIEALNPETQNKRNNSKSIKSVIIQFIISVALILIGIFLVFYSFGGIISFRSAPDEEATIAIVSILFASLIFILGMSLLGSILLPYLALIFSMIFNPIMMKMRKVCYRNLMNRPRRTKNTYLMISISLSFLIAVNIVVSSIEEGIIPGARMRLGGDIVLDNYWQHQAIIPMYTAEYISQLENVREVCAIKNSAYWNNLTTCDGYGFLSEERMSLIVINTSSYVRMHSSSIYSYQGSGSFHDFIHQLDVVGTVIVQDGLLERIGKSNGDNINITTSSLASAYFPELSADLTVVGTMNILPGVVSSWYHYEIEHYSAIISWDTYFNLTGSDYLSSTSNFLVECEDPYNADMLRNDIADLYQVLGSPWNSTSIDFDNQEMILTISQEISSTREIVNIVLIVIVSILSMSIVISMLGFLTSMEMNVHQRRTEIGVLRSIGFSKKQIIQVIFGEMMIICAVSLVAGIMGGIITGFLISNVPFIAYLPLIFTIRWIDILSLSIFITLLSILTSVVPAYKAIKLSIVDSIRKRRV